MNLDELRPILAAYRQQVERAWSPATAHTGCDGKAGDPAGQCGVTSAWLQRRLREDHGIEAWYCRGSITCLAHEEYLSKHCWLEIGEGSYRVVVDFTSSQIPCGLDVPVRPISDLSGMGIVYVTHRRLAAEELLTDPVQPRLALLTEALS